MNHETELDDEILENAKAGDEEAVGEIFSTYRNFVYLKARNYFLMGADREDLIQEGMIGLLKAIRGYDKEKLTSFKTFASICVKRQLITAIKSANSNKNMALNSSVNISAGGTGEASGGIVSARTKGLDSYVSYSPEEIVLSKEQIEGLKFYLKTHLSDFEYGVFKEMVRGTNYKEIAAMMNKKVKSVDNAMQRIKRKSEYWINKYREQ